MRFVIIVALLGSALCGPVPDGGYRPNNARATFLNFESDESSFRALPNNFIPESYGPTGQTGRQTFPTQVVGSVGVRQGGYALPPPPQVGYAPLGGRQNNFVQGGGGQGGFAQAGGNLGGGFAQAGGNLGGGFAQAGGNLGGGFAQAGGNLGGGFAQAGGNQGGRFAGACPAGQGRDALGNCVEAVLSQNVFVFKSPPLEVEFLPPPAIPQPKINHNIVYVHAPEAPPNPEPIVVGPDVTETKIYVLSKVPDVEQQIIEVAAQPPTQPDVFYLNYKEGEDHFLPGNIRLSEIINQASDDGLVYGANDLGPQPGGYAGSS